MLLKYAWQKDFCYPGQETLAKDMGVSDRSVRTYLQELEAEKFINIKQPRPRKAEPVCSQLAAFRRRPEKNGSSRPEIFFLLRIRI